MMVLEDQADVLCTPSLTRAQALDRDSAEEEAPAVGGIQEREQVEECRLAAAGWPGDRHHLRGCDVEVDPVESPNQPPVEGLAQPPRDDPNASAH